MTKPEISVVIGSFNRRSFLELTLETVRAELQACQFTSEIVVVDGGSTDGTLKWLLRQKDVVTIVQHNRGVWQGTPITRRSWGYFMNLGFKCAQGKYVCMLSDDCLVVPGAISNGHRLFEDMLYQGVPVGAMAFFWRNWPEKGKYFVGLTLGGKVFVNHGLYLRAALEDVGYIEEETYQFYYADSDLCLKMWQKGYSCVTSHESFIEHHAHANRKIRAGNYELAATDWKNFLNRWKGIYPVQEGETGGCIELDFADPMNTSEKFRRINGALRSFGCLKRLIGR